MFIISNVPNLRCMCIAMNKKNFLLRRKGKKLRHLSLLCHILLVRTSTGVRISIRFRFFCLIGYVLCMEQFPTFRLSIAGSVLFVGYMERIF